MMTNQRNQITTLSARITLALLLMLLIGACAAPQSASDRSTGAAEVIEAVDWPTLDESLAGQMLKVDRDRSELRIIVLAGGRLARFGHPHVIGGAAIFGQVFVADAPADSWLDLQIEVGEFEVDRPEWRQVEGFEPEMEADAIRDTRINLLGPDVLDAEQHPQIKIRGMRLIGPEWAAQIDLYIQIRDQRRLQRVPVHWVRTDVGIEASGVFTIRQTDFGMTPFSALSGALSVADDLTIRFRIVAQASQ